MGRIETRYGIEERGATWSHKFDGAQAVAIEVTITDKMVRVNGSYMAVGYRTRLDPAHAERILHRTPEAAWTAYRNAKAEAVKEAKAELAMLESMLEFAEAEITRIVQ